MKYIKVTNYVKEVNRLGLEKLGLSTKRDNDETIGQFGSGIKFAPIAAIRKGMDWAFVGSDKKGDYILKYVVKDDDGIPCVFYKYQDYEKASSFTAEAGLLSWTNDFQIYREVVANAIDESKVSGLPWRVDVVSVNEITHVDGEFSVYFTATDEMISIHENFNKYFSVDRIPVYEDKNFKLYMPIDNTFRVYVKGVLVYSDEANATNSDRDVMSGLFDYEFNSLELNEERTVANTWEMHCEIIRSWSKVNSEKLIEKIIQKMINSKDNNNYEFEAITTYIFNYGVMNALWREVFDKLYPNTVIIRGVDASFNALKTIESKGYNSITIEHEGIYSFLTEKCIPTASDVFGESFKYEYDMDISSYKNLNIAINMIETVCPEINFDFIVGVYVEENEEEINTLGMTLNLVHDNEPCKTILINKAYAIEASIDSLISTLIHEWDHFSTGFTDGDTDGRIFRNLADDRLGKLIYQTYKIMQNEMSIA